MATYLEYVKEKDFGSMHPVKSCAMVEGFFINLLGGEGVEQKKIITFEFDVSILSASFLGMNVESNDTISVYLQPENQGVIGVVSEIANSGQKLVKMTPPMPDGILFSGLVLCFGGDDVEYTIQSYDSETGIITLFQNLSENKNVSTTIHLRVYAVKNVPLLDSPQRFFSDFFGSKFIAKGNSIVLVYKCAVAPTENRNVPFTINYFYGERE